MKKYFFLCISLFSFGFCFAQVGFQLDQSFGVVDVFLLTGGGPVTNHLFISITGGISGNFSVNILNTSPNNVSLTLDFFDQVVTDDGMGNMGCSSKHTITDFASHMSWNAGSFIVTGMDEITIPVSFLYNYCVDGPSLGCAVAIDNIPGGGLGVANFVDINVSRDQLNCGKFGVKALPSYRHDTFDLTGFMGFWIGEDFSTMSGNNPSVTGMVGFSVNGTGEFMYPFPNQGSGYMVLFKAPGYLSVGYTGSFDINNVSGLDFTNLIGLAPYVYGSGWFSKIYMTDLPEVQGFSGDRSLLVAGDTNENDYIGASDLALINSRLTVNFALVEPKYDFDKNGYITSKDQAILVQNVSRNGFRRNFKDQLSSGLNVIDDVAPGSMQFPRIN